MTLAKAARDGDQQTLGELAREILAECHGDRRLAKTKLIAALKGDLLNTYLDRILGDFAESLLSREGNHRRREVPVTMNVVPINGATFNAAVRANFDRYMSRPIWGGKAVSDCSAAELRESADKFSKQGASMIREATWEFAVADALEHQRKTTEQTVGQVLDEASLSILWESSTDD